MTIPYFISDLHLGHKRILEFSPNREGSTVDEHDNMLHSKWCQTVRKRDIVFVLGDVAMNLEKLQWMQSWTGRKILIRGNHDVFPIDEYLKVFDNIYGLYSYKRFWLSHCPIHPSEMRNRKGNVHGHTHNVLVDDDRYFNVCVEWTDGYPISLEQVVDRSRFK